MMRPSLRYVLLSLFLATLSPAEGVDIHVTTNTDSLTGMNYGAPGELRYVINTINQNIDTYNIIFDNPGTITLVDQLPLINLDNGNTLVFNSTNQTITLDGSSTYPGFFLARGDITIQNMTFLNTIAQGGTGSGGGMGAGGALFIDQADVFLSNVNFTNNQAVGGYGTLTRSGGGGTFGGDGFAAGGGIGADGGSSGGGGGGGIAPGGKGGNAGINGDPGGQFASFANPGGNGNVGSGGANGGGGGGGGGGPATTVGGGGGPSGGNGSVPFGGDGSYGGGGSVQNAAYFGGKGGFGGGGGAFGGSGGFGGGGASSGATSGSGGFGGGAGESSSMTPGTPGVGAGLGTSGGGGGAGFGGAIFVNGSIFGDTPSYYNNGQGGGGGSLTFTGPVTITNPSVSGGPSDLGNSGTASGSALFASTGNTTNNEFTFSPPNSSDVITIGGSIGDDSAFSLPGGTYQGGAGQGVRLAKNGPGKLVLLSSNTYNGGTNLNEGTVEINANQPFGNPSKTVIVAGNATIQAGLSGLPPYTIANPIQDNGSATIDTNTVNMTLAGTITSTGNLIKTSTGTLFLTAANTYSGGTEIENGTLALSGNGALKSDGTVTVDAPGTFDISAINATSTFIGDLLGDGAVVLGGKDLRFGADSTTATFSGSISGNGGIIKERTGTAILSGTNTYTNGTKVNNGILVMSPTNLPLGVQPFAARVYNTATLKFGLASGTFAGNIEVNDMSKLEISNNTTVTLAGMISGTGSVVVDAGSTGIFTTVQKGYTGTTSIFGTLETEGQFLPAGGLVLVESAPSKLVFTTAGSNVFDGTIGGFGQVVMEGTGTQTITGNNFYFGGTVVNSGTLVGNTDSISDSMLASPSILVNNAGTLRFDQAANDAFDGTIELTAPLSTLAATGGGILTLSGPMIGSGRLQLNDAHVILTNDSNSYSGGTEVSANSILEGTSDSLQGAITDDGQLIFSQNFNGIFDGTISSTTSAGQIIKKGSGAVFFNNSNASFQGTTSIQEGGLVINNFHGGSVTVLPGAFLGGNGTIIQDVENNGFIMPGNSIGTLTIGGDYQQTFSGTYITEIDSIGNSDLINVAGEAFLGGSLVVVSLDGVIDSSKTYVILHANGGVHSVFAHVSSTNPLLVPNVTYLPNDVILGVKNIFIDLAMNHNQREVALQLLSITSPTPAEQVILTELSALIENPATADEALHALSQMSGEQYTNTLWISETTNRQFLRRLYDPLRSVMVADLLSCCHPPFYIYDCGCYTECNGWRDTCDNSLSTWIETGGGHSFQEHDTNASGFKLNSFEIAGGAQLRTTQQWTFGAAGEYSSESIHYNVGGNARNTSGLAGAYALYRPKWGYVLGDFTINYTSVCLKRPIDIGSLHFKTKGHQKALQETVYIEGGYDIACRCLLLQPFLGLEVNTFQANKVCEKGDSPLGLQVHKKNHTNTYSRLGLHLSAAKERWSAFIDIAWQCRLTSFQNTWNVNFQSFGSTFPILGVRVPRNSVDASAAFNAVLWEGWEFYGVISCERWAHASTYTALGGLKYSW